MTNGNSTTVADQAATPATEAPLGPQLPHESAPETSEALDRGIERAGRYVPRILQQHLVTNPGKRSWTAEGSAAFVDISGFTKLSEQLAKKGREGAEHITDAVGGSFEAILAVAYECGGSLLKFGGDALLLWFEGERHVERVCSATIRMRRVLRAVGRIEVPGAKVTLRMSQGVHSGHFHFFAVGTSHVELLPTGPGWTRLVEMEHTAEAGDIVVSPETASRLPRRCVGGQKGDGIYLLREPTSNVQSPLVPRPRMALDALSHCLSTAVRSHVLGGGGFSEHRAVTIAFVKFQGTDELIAEHGEAVAADALHQLVSVVQAAAEAEDVAFLASDLDGDGGKLILTAGAPKVTGDDEERMLLALRRIVSADLSISVRIGVNRGAVFAGDIGPFYRRTYTVMGDAVNLAARVMSKAEAGTIYATGAVLDRSNTLFDLQEVPPFSVKGKSQPVHAWTVGAAKSSRTRNVSTRQLPLIGRDVEMTTLREARESAFVGAGRLVAIIGEAGVGKTRLMEALREQAAGFAKEHVTCEAYTASVPYVAWRELLREHLGIGREEPDATVVDRIREIVAARLPDLAPWLPLIAAAFGIEVPPTPEVEMLAEKNRRPKLHEVALRFLEAVMSETTLVEFENAHHMDEASAAFLNHVAKTLAIRSWLILVAARPGKGGFEAADAETVVRMPLGALDAPSSLRLTKIATEADPLPQHVLETVVKRSEGNPQFLRDLLQVAIETGGADALPDSAESAAMARIDALSPEDRDVVRRAAVLGLSFHPRMLDWFSAEHDAKPVESSASSAWTRLAEIFDDDGDGYLRFRRSLLRDAAYHGLPYKLRRRLHRTVAERLLEELEEPDESAAILSLHYYEAGEYFWAWQFANTAAKRANAAFAYVEAAGLYQRALESGKRLQNVPPREMRICCEALGDAWYSAAEYRRATDAYGSASRLSSGDPLAESNLLLKRSKLEEKLGKYRSALVWAARARRAVERMAEREAAVHRVRAQAWYAHLLQVQGRSLDAVRCAEKAIAEAEAIDDPEALGAACFVMGWAYGVLKKEGGQELLKRSLDAFRRSGNLLRQATLLSNLGVMAQWEGRWDEALLYYEQGVTASQKIGATVQAAVAQNNIAEILADRGDVDEATRILLETLPLWKSSGYRYYLGTCLCLLARASLRAADVDTAYRQLEEARRNFEYVGAEQEILEVDARLTECALYREEPSRTVALAQDLMDRGRSFKGFKRLVPLLERVRGYALLQQRDLGAAKHAFQASLAAARSRSDPFETLQTLIALNEHRKQSGDPGEQEFAPELDELVARLRIRVFPSIPLERKAA